MLLWVSVSSSVSEEAGADDVRMSRDLLACLTGRRVNPSSPTFSFLLDPHHPEHITNHRPPMPSPTLALLLLVESDLNQSPFHSPAPKATEPGGVHPYLSSQVLLTDENYIFVSHQLHRDSAGDREPEMMPDNQPESKQQSSGR